jgi:hypothetical protein
MYIYDKGHLSCDENKNISQILVAYKRMNAKKSESRYIFVAHIY